MGTCYTWFARLALYQRFSIEVSVRCAGVRSLPSARRGGQMVFVCDGERRAMQRWLLSQISTRISVPSPGSPARVNIPSPRALWCSCHCVYREKSGKYVKFKTKRRGINGQWSYALKIPNDTRAKMQRPGFSDVTLLNYLRHIKTGNIYVALVFLSHVVVVINTHTPAETSSITPIQRKTRAEPD